MASPDTNYSMTGWSRRCAFLMTALLIVGTQIPAAGSADRAESAVTDKAEAANPPPQPSRSEVDKLPHARAKFVINAPVDTVWEVLTNFPEYPHIFQRIQSCRVTRQEGNLVWTESNLKPHLFVKTPRQHTVNDLSRKPRVLDWKVLDGNFKTVVGKWELSPAGKGDSCSVTYTLAVDPGPVVPKFLVSFTLHNLQKEITTALKEWVESTRLSNRGNLRAVGNNRSI